MRSGRPYYPRIKIALFCAIVAYSISCHHLLPIFLGSVSRFPCDHKSGSLRPSSFIRSPYFGNLASCSANSVETLLSDDRTVGASTRANRCAHGIMSEPILADTRFAPRNLELSINLSNRGATEIFVRPKGRETSLPWPRSRLEISAETRPTLSATHLSVPIYICALPRPCRELTMFSMFVSPVVFGGGLCRRGN